MPSTVVLTEVFKPANGKVFVRYADGTELEFSSLAALEQELEEIDSNAGMTQMMALGWIHARQPLLNNINPIKDKDFTYDLSNPNPIRVSDG